MSTAWKCLPVREFISQCNWEQVALTKSIRLQAQQQELPANWQCLTVRDFFAFQNWSGQGRFVPGRESERDTADFSLTLPVAQFWQCFNWSGIKAIPAEAEVEQIIEDTEQAIAEVKDFSLNDLSQLF